MKKSSLTSASSESGFTLLEILIAITLLAFITLGVVNITENAALTMERTTEVNKNNLQIETAMSRFEWDFSQIYSPLYFSTVMNLNPQANSYPTEDSIPGQGGTQSHAAGPELQNYYEQLVMRFERNEHFSGVSKEGMPIPRFYAPEKDVFEFFTTSNRRKTENVKQSHFAWVRYSLAPPDSSTKNNDDSMVKLPPGLKNLVRYFSADDPYADQRLNIDDSTKVKGAVLLENVEKLEFHFWDFQRRKWETSLRNIQGGEGLLRGVKVTITWYDYSGNQRSVSRIFRNHWPMVVPQDPVQRPGTAAPGPGSSPGTPETSGTTSPNPPEDLDD